MGRKLKDKICKYCNGTYQTRWNQSTFCSRKCAAIYNNKGKIRTKEQRTKTSQALKKYYLDNPKKIIRGQKLSIAVGKSTKGKYNDNPKSILELSKRTIGKIFKRLNLGCSRCGWNQCRCDIHHIYGKKIINANNHSNLAYLCPNCHRMIHQKKIDPKDIINLESFIHEKWKIFYYG